MKILVLKSSGNKRGSSNMLADEFIRGAKESGNEVTEFDVIRADIRPCLGCNSCMSHNGACVRNDDYEKTLKSLLLETDMIVFVMPVYYFGWPAQLKVAVDRFYSVNDRLMGMKKKCALLAVAYDDTDAVFEAVLANYRQIYEYMNFQNVGAILGKGCGTPDMTKASPYPNAAYELGKTVR